MKKYGYFGVIWQLTRKLTRRYLRDKTAVFFSVIFPIIFLLVFGGIFGRAGGSKFDVALYYQKENDFASQFIESLNSAPFIVNKGLNNDIEKDKEKLGRGELDAIIILPSNFGELDTNKKPQGEINILYDEGSVDTARTFDAVMQGIADEYNRTLTPDYKPAITVNMQPAKSSGLKAFDYTVSGLLGFSILSMGIFSVANGFVADKKNGSLRRMQVTPIRTSQFIISTMLTRVFVGIFSLSAMLGVAVVLFNFTMRGSVLYLLAFSILSLLMMFGFGMAIAGWAKSEEQAAPVANLVAFPMMFLSGSFFPRFIMPEWLQAVSFFLPLTPVVDGLRYIIAGTATLTLMLPIFGLILGWTVVTYTIAFNTFKWE